MLSTLTKKFTDTMQKYQDCQVRPHPKTGWALGHSACWMTNDGLKGD